MERFCSLVIACFVYLFKFNRSLVPRCNEVTGSDGAACRRSAAVTIRALRMGGTSGCEISARIFPTAPDSESQCQGHTISRVILGIPGSYLRGMPRRHRGMLQTPTPSL